MRTQTKSSEHAWDVSRAKSWALIAAGAALVAFGLLHGTPSRAADAPAPKAARPAVAVPAAVAGTPAATKAAHAALPVGHVDAMRGNTPLDEEARPPALGNDENKDLRRNRAFPMQPPTIPHRIDGYQVDRNANKCMTCHSRTRIEESKAIPIPATHYMDRDGQMLGDVSKRRYFCTQCHVPQAEAKLLIDNRYQDFDTVVRSGARPAAAKK